MNSVKENTVVQLLSGSPSMTVEHVIINSKTGQPNGLIRCVWFDGTTRKWADFKEGNLKEIKDNQM